MIPIEQACFWMATRPPQKSIRLQEPRKTDIAIAGAGFTGLWTALFLKGLDPSVDVTILEQGFAGYGGSGRNAGILGETIDHSHQLAIAHFGLEEARRLAEIGRTNIEEMTQFFAMNNIDCDFERTGRLFVALTPAHIEEAKRSMESASLLGVRDVKLLDAEQTRAELNSPLYLGGMFAPGGGILNPVKLIDGLKRVAENRGVTVFENSAATAVSGSGITTQAGFVSAKKIILATDAFTHHLSPKLLKRFVPLYDYILVSEPLTAQQHRRIGWQHRQGVTDGRTFFNYYRLTKDNRILWGTSEAKYYYPNRVEASCDHSEQHYSDLKQSFLRHFPELAELQFPYAWGGPIASTTRLTPFFGTLEKGKLLYGLGYTGHGIGSTRVAGKILAHMALERHSDLLDLAIARKKPFPYPPEPFRAIAIESVTQALRKVDSGKQPGLLLRILDKIGIGFSS